MIRRKLLRIILVFGLIISISLLSTNANAQFTTNLSVSVERNNFIVNEIPAYITVDSALSIPVEGIYVKSKSSFGISLGATVHKKIYSHVSVRSGIILNYRRAELTYYDENLFFFDNSNPAIYRSLAININRDFLVLQIPVGITFPVYSNFFVDVAALNNLILKTTHQYNTNDPSFEYKLVTLDNRSTHQMLFELSLGLGYRSENFALRIDYIRSITALQKTIDNAYNQIVPANLYFSSMRLSIDVPLNLLFSLHSKR